MIISLLCSILKVTPVISCCQITVTCIIMFLCRWELWPKVLCFYKLSIHPILWMWYLRNAMCEFLQVWPKHLLGLNHELIRIWWSKVKGQRDTTKHIFTLHIFWTLMKHSFTQMSIRIKWWRYAIYIQKVKGQLHCDITQFCKNMKHLKHCLLLCVLSESALLAKYVNTYKENTLRTFY